MTAVMQWSELARNPREVAATVEREGEARLERRGEGQSFVLMTMATLDATRAGVSTAERLLRNAVAHAVRLNDVDELLADTFPWTRFLHPDARREFAEGFVDTFSACADLDVWVPLQQFLTEWMATAAIYADPELADKLRGPFEVDMGPVPEPDMRHDAEEG